MDGNKAHFRVQLTEEELGLPAIDDLINKYRDWVKLSKESGGERKTRSANKRADAVYEEILAFRLPPIKIKLVPVISPSDGKPTATNASSNNSSKSSIDGDSSESSSINSAGRILRPRCRTPSASPSTPTHQNIRAHMKRDPGSNSNSNSANVLSAALNQQHPSVSVTKIRQLLRADSAQKKREEEKERLELVRMQRKVKEERAEAQKRQLLEERAITAKLNREKRLLHAAEVRKAREKNRIEQKLKEDPPKNISKDEPSKNQAKDEPTKNHTRDEPLKNHVVEGPPKKQSKEETTKKQAKEEPPRQQVDDTTDAKEKDKSKQGTSQATKEPVRKMDETFQKPADDNIDISVCDETIDEQKKHPTPIASWAKAPGLRDLVVAQYSKSDEELMREALRIFRGVQLPVKLDEIFGPSNAVGNRYLCRTSSAVWSTPHKPLKRTSSDVLTPNDPKRHV